MSAESALPKKATFGWPFSLALNHLLEGAPWARARLARFAGATVQFRSPPFPALCFAILSDGKLEPAGAEPTLVVTVKPDAVVNLPRGPEHFLRSIAVAGDPALAAEVLFLARHLRWDAEEDLSKVFGDVAAHRLAEAGRAFAAWQRDALRRLAGAFADYAIDEKRVLIARPEMEGFREGVAHLRDGIERLDKRIERLG